MEMWFKTKTGAHYHLNTVDDTEETNDAFFDQLKLGDFSFITKNDFICKDPFTIDVMSSDLSKKLGTLTFERVNL